MRYRNSKFMKLRALAIRIQPVCRKKRLGRIVRVFGPENVRWLDGDPVSGRYTVWIHLFRPRGEASVEFELMGKTGDNIEVQNADVEPGNEIAIFRFYFFAGNVSDQDRAKQLADLKLLQAREEEAATKLLNAARGKQVDAQLYAIAVQYPHTDAAVEALKRMTGNTQK